MLKKVYFVCLLSVFSTEAAVSQYQDTKGNVNLNVTAAKRYYFNKDDLVNDNIRRGKSKAKTKFIVGESGEYQVSYQLGWTTDDPSSVQLQTFVTVNGSKAATGSIAYGHAKKDLNDGYATNASFFYLNLNKGDQVALKYKVIDAASSKVRSMPNASNISFEYKGPITSQGSGEAGGHGLTCKDIKRKKPSAASGIYKLDPDGAKGEIQPFDAYCDMESQGGGWTLVGVKKYGKEPTAVVSPLSSPDIDEGVVDDNIWAWFRANGTEIYAKLDVDAWATFNIDTLKNANCKPLANSLTDLTLAHAETDQCWISGGDYSFFGVNAKRAAFYDYSNTPLIKNRGGSEWGVISSGPYVIHGEKLMVYVK